MKTGDGVERDIVMLNERSPNQSFNFLKQCDIFVRNMYSSLHISVVKILIIC